MKLNRVHVAVMAALTSVGGLSVQTASAQQGGLEEIVVTATRRSEDLQEVPISIVAITGEGLQTRGLQNVENLNATIPNLSVMGNAGGLGTSGTSFRVRGIPNVGTYIDGVWQISTNGFLTEEFVDLDRVEVLRGPQGTLFGRDSVGGAMRIFTKRPTDEFGGTFKGTLGTLQSPRRHDHCQFAVQRKCEVQVHVRGLEPRRLHHEPSDGQEGRGYQPVQHARRYPLDPDRENRHSDPDQPPDQPIHRAARRGRRLDLFGLQSDGHCGVVVHERGPAFRPELANGRLARRHGRKVGEPLGNHDSRTSSRPTRHRSTSSSRSRTRFRSIS